MPCGGVMVGFLAPRMREEAGIVMLEPLGIYAQALSFLNFLIADPIPAVGPHRSGVLVQVPRPERYAVHKLIVAQRRTRGSAAKSRKDLAHAAILIEVLAEDRPYALDAAYRTAIDSGPKWREAIERALKQRPEFRETIASLS